MASDCETTVACLFSLVTRGLFAEIERNNANRPATPQNPPEKARRCNQAGSHAATRRIIQRPFTIPSTSLPEKKSVSLIHRI